MGVPDLLRISALGGCIAVEIDVAGIGRGRAFIVVQKLLGDQAGTAHLDGGGTMPAEIARNLSIDAPYR